MRDMYVGDALRNTSWQQETFTIPDYHSTSLPASRPVKLNLRFQQCIHNYPYVRPGPWGTYTNGASLKHFGRLQSLGKMPNVDGELDHMATACSSGLVVSYICRDLSCYDPNKKFYSDGLFKHIGARRVNTSIDARSTAAGSVLAVAKHNMNETLWDLHARDVFAAKASSIESQSMPRAMPAASFGPFTGLHVVFLGLLAILFVLVWHKAVWTVTLRQRKQLSGLKIEPELVMSYCKLPRYSTV